MIMYLVLVTMAILQTTRCQDLRQTQMLFKMEQKDGFAFFCERTPAEITFKKFIQETYFYIDKTLLLKEIFDKKSMNVLITAPRKWGKSLNLRMMEYFLGMQLTSNYSMKPAEQTDAYKFFVEGKTLSSHGKNMEYTVTPVPISEIRFNKPPLISNHPEFVAEHLAQHAVIYLNLEDFGPAFTYDEFFLNFKTAIVNIYKRHRHVKDIMEERLETLKSKAETDLEAGLIGECLDSELKQFNRFLDVNDRNADEWTISIVTLTEYIKEYLKKKAIILMDNQDYMIKMMSYMEKGQRNKVYEFLLDFTEDTFHFNPNLYRCISTGIMPMVMRDKSRSGETNFKYLGNVFNELHPFYGFTYDEFKQLTEYLRTQEYMHDDAIEQYGGYFNHTLINPFDACKFLNTYSVSNFWAQENDVDIQDPHIGTNSSRYIIVRQLLHDQCLPVEVVPTFPLIFSVHDQKLLSSVWMGRESVEIENVGDTDSTDDFLMYMLVKGIVTPDRQNNELCLRVPNKEAKVVLRHRFPRPNTYTGKESDDSGYDIIYHPH